MKIHLEFNRNLYLTVYAIFVCGALIMTTYTLLLLRAGAVNRAFEISGIHAQTIEDLLTQSLNNSRLIAASVLIHADGADEAAHVVDSFSTALAHFPALRSMSLLDERNRIVLSSNPANVGKLVPTRDYFPPDTGQGDGLRIGKPWEGRDFSDGRESSGARPVERNVLSLVPVEQTLVAGERRVTLLLGLNTDYFLNRMARQLEAEAGTIDVYRYDGTLLLTSDPGSRLGERFEDLASHFDFSVKEFGFVEHENRFGLKVLTAFRASRTYPFVVVTRLDQTVALQSWTRQARTLVAVVALALLVISVLAFAYYRRQLLSFRENAESARLQRINATVFDSSTEAILIADTESRIVSINPAFSAVSGYADDEILGRRLPEFLTPESADEFAEYVHACQLPERPGEMPHCGVTEGQLVCKNGQVLWTEMLSTPEYDGRGKIIGYHRICRNISERKMMEDKVKQLAFFDPLTNLPNRRLFDDRFHQVLVACRRSGYYGALVFLDLDNFKPLNDTHGHASGDLLLIEVAHRIKACVREVDTVARFGGDEFVVLLAALGNSHGEAKSQAEAIAEKIRLSLSEAYRLKPPGNGDQAALLEHSCTASIGAVVFSGQDRGPEDILSLADAAMYRVKELGRNRIHFHVDDVVSL